MKSQITRIMTACMLTVALLATGCGDEGRERDTLDEQVESIGDREEEGREIDSDESPVDEEPMGGEVSLDEVENITDEAILPDADNLTDEIFTEENEDGESMAELMDEPTSEESLPGKGLPADEGDDDELTEEDVHNATNEELAERVLTPLFTASEECYDPNPAAEAAGIENQAEVYALARNIPRLPSARDYLTALV